MARSIERRFELGKGVSNRQLENFIETFTCGGKLKGTIYKEVTINPGSLADGAGSTSAVTVRGAALGDMVLVSTSVDLIDVTVTSYVQAADLVEIRFQNESAGVRDIASGTFRILVLDFT